MAQTRFKMRIADQFAMGNTNSQFAIKKLRYSNPFRVYICIIILVNWY